MIYKVEILKVKETPITAKPSWLGRIFGLQDCLVAFDYEITVQHDLNTRLTKNEIVSIVSGTPQGKQVSLRCLVHKTDRPSNGSCTTVLHSSSIPEDDKRIMFYGQITWKGMMQRQQ